VTPQAERFLHNADDHLGRGQAMIAARLNDDAGRAAYLAAFHAAQAIIFERTGKVYKSHKGVNIEFLRLTKDNPHFSPSSVAFFPKPTTSKLSLTTKRTYCRGFIPRRRGCCRSSSQIRCYCPPCTDTATAELTFQIRSFVQRRCRLLHLRSTESDFC
jgi:HEPN domain